MFFFFFQAEDGIRDFCLSRGLGDVYKRQIQDGAADTDKESAEERFARMKAEAEAKMEDSTPYLSEAFTADDMYKAMVSGGRLENRPAMAWKPMDKI